MAGRYCASLRLTVLECREMPIVQRAGDARLVAFGASAALAAGIAGLPGARLQPFEGVDEQEQGWRARGSPSQRRPRRPRGRSAPCRARSPDGGAKRPGDRGDRAVKCDHDDQRCQAFHASLRYFWISVLEGSSGSISRAVCSAPVTGSADGSSSPSCTSIVA
jgi:hypothetical protein